MSAPVAAIDCGTNSTRLLVVGPEGETLERLMRITRLGQGVDRTGPGTRGHRTNRRRSCASTAGSWTASVSSGCG